MLFPCLHHLCIIPALSPWSPRPTNSLYSVADPGFSPGGGAPTPKSANYFSIFCRKLHENERIWTPRGGVHPWRPPWIRQWYLFKLNVHPCGRLVIFSVFSNAQMIYSFAHMLPLYTFLMYALNDKLFCFKYYFILRRKKQTCSVMNSAS